MALENIAPVLNPGDSLPITPGSLAPNTQPEQKDHHDSPVSGLAAGLARSTAGTVIERVISDMGQDYDPNYNVFEAQKDEFESGRLNPAEFAGVYSESGFVARRQLLEKRKEYDRVAAMNPVSSFIGGMVGAAPEMLLPAGAVIRGARAGAGVVNVGRTALSAGVANAAVTLGSEMVRVGADPRANEEIDALSVGAAGVLGYGIGGIAAARMSRVERRALELSEKKLLGVEDPAVAPKSAVADPATLDLGQNLPTGRVAEPFNPDLAGEITVTTRDGRMVVVDGVERAAAAQRDGVKSIKIKVIDQRLDPAAVRIDENVASGRMSLAEAASIAEREQIVPTGPESPSRIARDISRLSPSDQAGLRAAGLDDEAVSIVGRASDASPTLAADIAAAGVRTADEVSALVEVANRNRARDPSFKIGEAEVKLARDVSELAAKMADAPAVRALVETTTADGRIGAKGRALMQMALEPTSGLDELIAKGADAKEISNAIDAFLPNRALPDELNPASVGAASTMAETTEDVVRLRDAIKVSAGGTEMAETIARLGFNFTPLLRTLHSPVASVRRFSTELFDRGFNVDGAARASIEATQRVQIARTMLETMQESQTIYQQMVRAGIVMGEDEFRRLISNAIRMGEKSPNEFVQRAAALWNSKVYNPQLRARIDAGLITEGTQIGSEGYLNRIHLPDEIKTRPDEFKRIIREDAQQRLRAEYAKETDDLNRALEHLDQQARDEGLDLAQIRTRSSELRYQLKDLYEANAPYREIVPELKAINDEISALRSELESAVPSERGVIRKMIREQEDLKKQIVQRAEEDNGVVRTPNGRRSYDRAEALTYDDFNKRRSEINRRLDALSEQRAAERELQSLRDEADDMSVSTDPVARQQRIDALNARLDDIRTQAQSDPDVIAAADELKQLWTKWRDAKALGDKTAMDIYRDEINQVNRTPAGQSLTIFNQERSLIKNRLNNLAKDDVALSAKREEIARIYEDRADKLAQRHKSLSDRYASLLSKMEGFERKDAAQQAKAVAAIQKEMNTLLRDIDRLSDARSKLDAAFVERMATDFDSAMGGLTTANERVAVNRYTAELNGQLAMDRAETSYRLRKEARQKKHDAFLAEQYVEKPGTPEQQAERLRKWTERREKKIAEFESGEAERLAEFEASMKRLEEANAKRADVAEDKAVDRVVSAAGKIESTGRLQEAGDKVQQINNDLTKLENARKDLVVIDDQIRKVEIKGRTRKNGLSEGDKARIERLREKRAELETDIELLSYRAENLPEPDFAGSKRIERYNSRAQKQLSAMREHLLDAQENLSIDMASIQQPSATTIAKVKDLAARADTLREDSFDILENGFRRQMKLEARLKEIEDDVARATERRVAIGSDIQRAEQRARDDRARRADEIERRKAQLEDRHDEKWGSSVRQDDDFYTAAEDIAESVRINLTGENMENMHRNGNTKIGLARDPWKERTLIIDDMKLAEAGFLEQDINVLAESYLRSSIADVELTKRFGDPMMKSAFQKMEDEYAMLRRSVENAQSDTEIERIIGVRPGLLRPALDMIKRKAGIERNVRAEALEYLTTRQKQDVRDLTWALNKIRGTGENGSDLARAALNYTYTTRGGGFLISNLGDVGRIYMELGLRDGLNETMSFFAGLRRNERYKGMIAKMSAEDRDLANEIGVATEGIMHSALMQESGYQTVMNRGVFGTVEKLGGYANKLNGMQYLQAFSETVASKVMLKRVEQGLLGKDEWVMNQLKLPAEDIPRYKHYLDNFGTRRDDGSLSGFGFSRWEGPDAQRLANELSAKINEQVLSVVTRRGMGDIPIWAQGGSPWLGDFGRLIAQFGGYSMSSFQKGAIRNAQNMSKAKMATYLGAMTGLGMMTTWLKLTVNEFGKDPEESRKSTNPGWWLSEGIKASPILAMPLWFGSKVSDLSGIDPLLDPIRAGGRLANGLDQEQNAAGKEIKDFKPSLIGAMGPFFGSLDRFRAGITEPMGRDGGNMTPRDVGNIASGIPFMQYHGARQAIEHLVKPLVEE